MNYHANDLPFVRDTADLSNPIAFRWWNKTAYMGHRAPVIPSTSYFFSFVDDPRRTDPVKRAAAISSAVLDFKKLVDEETLSPDYSREVPQAMDGYRYLFNSCRIPDKPTDYTATYDPGRYKHILVGE